MHRIHNLDHLGRCRRAVQRDGRLVQKRDDGNEGLWHAAADCDKPVFTDDPQRFCTLLHRRIEYSFSICERLAKGCEVLVGSQFVVDSRLDRLRDNW